MLGLCVIGWKRSSRDCSTVWSCWALSCLPQFLSRIQCVAVVCLSCVCPTHTCCVRVFFHILFSHCRADYISAFPDRDISLFVFLAFFNSLFIFLSFIVFLLFVHIFFKAAEPLCQCKNFSTVWGWMKLSFYTHHFTVNNHFVCGIQLYLISLWVKRNSLSLVVLHYGNNNF